MVSLMEPHTRPVVERREERTLEAVSRGREGESRPNIVVVVDVVDSLSLSL